MMLGSTQQTYLIKNPQYPHSSCNKLVRLGFNSIIASP
jgi:hypothetical protein